MKALEESGLSEFEQARVKKLVRQLEEALGKAFDEAPHAQSGRVDEVLALSRDLEKMGCKVTWVVGGRNARGEHAAQVHVTFPRPTKVKQPQE